MGRDWQETTVGEHVDLVTGEAFQSAHFGTTPDSGTLLARGDNIKEGEFEWGDKARYWPEPTPDLARYLLREGDVLLGMDGSKVGKNWVQVREKDLPCLLVQRVARLRAKPTMDQGFLRYIIGNPQFRDYIGRVRTGTSIPHISGGQIKAYEILFPPLPEQKAIAAVLGALDDKIECNQRMNETLEALIQGLFKSWFVDAGLAEGWRESSIRELAGTIQYGLSRSASSEPVGPRFLRITDIQGGRVDWSSVPFCEVSEMEHQRYRLNAGDVLVARTGASTGENIYLRDAPDALFASYLVRFQFRDAAMARFVGAFMRTPAYSDFVAGCIGGSAQPNASAQTLAGAKLSVPPQPLLKRFAEIVTPLDRRAAANNEESRILAILRDTLLPKLLSGELRIAA